MSQVDTIISQLVEFDIEAKRMVNLALEERQQIDSTLQVEKAKAYEQYSAKALERVEKYQEHIASENEEKNQQVIVRYEAAVKQLEDDYKANKERWVAEIFTHCVTP